MWPKKAEEHKDLRLTLRWTLLHTVVFVGAIRTVLKTIAELVWRNADVWRRPRTKQMGGSAGRRSHSWFWWISGLFWSIKENRIIIPL